MCCACLRLLPCIVTTFPLVKIIRLTFSWFGFGIKFELRHVSKFKEEAAAVENMIMEEGTSVNEHST